MTQTVTPSFAKINLTLEVSAKREDGYHDIDSIVQIIDIKDELVFSEAEPGVIEVTADVDGVPSGRGNLVYRACEAFFEATGVRGGAKIDLKKRIPAQAGLGGGSGNAAAAIAGLCKLYQHNLSVDDASAIGIRIGSDVPLFLYGGTVRMRGRGERVERLRDAPELNIVVLKPGIGVSTPWAYAQLDRRASTGPPGASDRAERSIRAGDRECLISGLENDFDPVVSSSFEEIARAKAELLETGARAAMLAGSGSAVFGVFDTQDQARAAGDKLTGRFQSLFVTRSLGAAESSLLAEHVDRI